MRMLAGVLVPRNRLQRLPLGGAGWAPVADPHAERASAGSACWINHPRSPLAERAAASSPVGFLAGATVAGSPTDCQYA